MQEKRDIFKLITAKNAINSVVKIRRFNLTI